MDFRVETLQAYEYERMPNARCEVCNRNEPELLSRAVRPSGYILTTTIIRHCEGCTELAAVVVVLRHT